MDELYRSLGREREAELIREAERLHAGTRARAARRSRGAVTLRATGLPLLHRLRRVGAALRLARGSS